MCLAVPLKLVSVQGRAGVGERDGVRLPVALDLVPEAVLGDFVLVHAGYAIARVDAEAAAATMELLRELTEEA